MPDAIANLPKAVTWLNYDRDVRDGLTVGQAMGPNTLGEWLYVIEWTYDPEKVRTRVGLSYMPPQLDNVWPFRVDGERAGRGRARNLTFAERDVVDRFTMVVPDA